MDYENKKLMYVSYFSIGTMTTGSFDEKLELCRLLCFLSHTMNLKDPFTFPNTLKVLEKIIGREIDKSESPTGEDAFLVALSIICDDFLYQVDKISKPEEYTNAKDMVDRIKELIGQWSPF